MFMRPMYTDQPNHPEDWDEEVIEDCNRIRFGLIHKTPVSICGTALRSKYKPTLDRLLKEFSENGGEFQPARKLPRSYKDPNGPTFYTYTLQHPAPRPGSPGLDTRDDGTIPSLSSVTQRPDSPTVQPRTEQN